VVPFDLREDRHQLILFFAGAKMMVMVEMPSALRQFIVKCSIMIFV